MTVLELLDRYDRLTGHGWLTADEALLLACCMEWTKGPIVEVGSYQGRSAMLFAMSGRRVYCIDPWDDTFDSDLTGDQNFERFNRNLHEINADYVAIRSKVEDVKPIKVELVYLDGDHTYSGTRAQLDFALACEPKIIAVHDVNDTGEGVLVKRACLEVLGEWKNRLGRVGIWEIR